MMIAVLIIVVLMIVVLMIVVLMIVVWMIVVWIIVVWMIRDIMSPQKTHLTQASTFTPFSFITHTQRMIHSTRTYNTYSLTDIYSTHSNLL